MPITRRRRANPPDQPENNNHLAEQTESAAESLPTESPSTQPNERDNLGVGSEASLAGRGDTLPSPHFPIANGDRLERQDYTPPIEGGRRTPRGELFRRPPQPPPATVPAPTSAVGPASLPTPTHEIVLPLEGNLLHLAYNPGYTGSDESRSQLLHQLANESKAGGRARCWNCGSLSIVYECWSTRSKTFGEVGVAICEVCGVWSVM